MNWEAIGAIAEILGVVAVVASLLFVGRQVSSSNQEARARTMQAALDSEMFVGATLAGQPETWEKVVTGVPITDPITMRQGCILYNLLMLECENRFHQFNSGFLSADSWEGRVSSLPPLVLMPIYDTWKKTPAGMNHSADFLEFLEDLKDSIHK